MRDTIEDLRVRDAARDIDLCALFEIDMLGEARSVPVRRAEILEDYSEVETSQLLTDIKRSYDLSDPMLKRAIGRTIASVAGINVGADFFDEQA